MSESTLEQKMAMLASIKVPEQFNQSLEASTAYKAGVLSGRTDVLEDLSKFSQALLQRAEHLHAAGDEEQALMTATAAGAQAEFSHDYIQRLRNGET